MTDTYTEGHTTGSRFRAMEERGWDPGNTYLALMVAHKDDAAWIAGFDHGVNGMEATCA